MQDNTERGFSKAFTASCLLFTAVLLLVLLSCSSSPSVRMEETGEKTSREFSTVVKSLIHKLNTSSESLSGKKLAVMTFVSTKKTDGTKADEFGSYFSESLVSAVSMNSLDVVLFERNRLDLILEENALSVSGLIDEQLAKKIGKLIPVDLILSGTYTKLKSYIDINCRLIEVFSGRIVFTCVDRISMTEDLASLFDTQPQKITADDSDCKSTEQLKKLLNDLSSEEKVNNAVKRAILIPFDLECGVIHFDVIYTFRKYKIISPDYRQFLLGELSKIDFPAKDRRAYEILRYFTLDDVIDAQEWSAGLKILQKIGDHSMSSHLHPLLAFKSEDMDFDSYYTVTVKRIDEFFGLVQKGKVGLPVAIDFRTAFFELMEAFNYIYTSDNRMLLYCYEKFGSELSTDRADKQVNSLLNKMYFREKDPACKEKILDWFIDFFNRREPGEELARDMFDFVRLFEITDYKKKHPEELDKIPEEHLNRIVRACGPQFCMVLPYTKFRSAREDRIDFCLKHDITCPLVIPTPADAEAMVESSDWNKRLRGAELLSTMKDRAASVEVTLVSEFYQTEGGSSAVVALFQGYIVTVLGNIRSTNPDAIALLIEALASLKSSVPDKAVIALARIGEPALPALIKALSSPAGSVQVKAAKSLALMGPKAKKAVPALKRMAQSNFQAISKAAHMALKAISPDVK